MTKVQLVKLWEEYKQIRRRIDLPVNQNEEKTILSFFNWVDTSEGES